MKYISIETSSYATIQREFDVLSKDISTTSVATTFYLGCSDPTNTSSRYYDWNSRKKIATINFDHIIVTSTTLIPVDISPNENRILWQRCLHKAMRNWLLIISNKIYIYIYTSCFHFPPTYRHQLESSYWSSSRTVHHQLEKSFFWIDRVVYTRSISRFEGSTSIQQMNLIYIGDQLINLLDTW